LPHRWALVLTLAGALAFGGVAHADLLGQVDQAFVLEDHYAAGGLASILLRLGLPLKIVSLAWPSDWSGQSGKPLDVLKMFQLDPAGIADRISAAVVSCQH